MSGCRSPKHTIKQLAQSIIHFFWHLPASRCTFLTSFAYPVKWDNEFRAPACFISLIKSCRCQLGVEYLGAQFTPLLVHRGRATVGNQEGAVGRKVRYQLLWPPQMSARQSVNLRGENQKRLCRICERPSAKCQTNICRDEVRCQSEISVSIQRAHTRNSNKINWQRQAVMFNWWKIND